MKRLFLCAAPASFQASGPNGGRALPVEDRHIDRELPGCGSGKDGCAGAELTSVEVTGGPAVAGEGISAA